MASHHRKISQEEWERHKSTIRRLRFDEKLPIKGKNPNGRSLMQVMQDEHQFQATASQYELQIKAWGDIKNLKKRDWEAILPVYDGLESRGLAPRVRVGDYVFRETKVKRARREYGKRGDLINGNAISDSIPFSDPTRLWCLEFRQQDGQYVEYSETFEERLISDGLTPTTNVQGDGHDNVLDINSLPPVIPPSAVSNALSVPNTPRMDLTYIFPSTFSPIQNSENTDELISSFLEPYTYTYSPFVDFDVSASLALSNGAISAPVHSTIPPSLSPPAIALKDEIETIFRTAGPGALFSIDGSAISPSDVAVRLASLPGSSFFDQGSVGGPSLASCGMMRMQEIGERVLYSIINNFVGLENIAPPVIVKMLRLAPAMMSYIFQWLRSGNSIIAKPLAENLFRAAIGAGDEEVVDAIMKTTLGKINEIDVNAIICPWRSDTYSPIALASRLRHSGTVERLLSYGAKVSLFGHRPGSNIPIRACALQETIDLFRNDQDKLPGIVYGDDDEGYQVEGFEPIEQPNNDILCMLKLLLSACEQGKVVELFIEILSDIRGAHHRFRLRPISKAERCRLVEILFPLISPERYIDILNYKEEKKFGSYCETYTTCNTPILWYIVGLETQLAEKTILAILAVYESTHIGTSHEQEYGEQWREVLVLAILESKFWLEERLLEHVKLDERHLTAAIRKGRFELVDSIMKKGVCARGDVMCYKHLFHKIPDPSGRAWVRSRGGVDCHPTTPLAEAIRLQNTGLINHLESCGALDRIPEKGALHFESAVTAISEVGNFSYLMRLLTLDPIVSLKIMRGPIQSAIEMNQLETAWSLIIHSPKVDSDPVSIIPDNFHELYLGHDEIIDILCVIVQKRELEFMERVLDYYDRFDNNILEKPLLQAVQAGDQGSVEYILQLGIIAHRYHSFGAERDSYIYIYSLFSSPIHRHNIDLVRLLLKWGARPRTLQSAVEAADENILHLLLSYGVDPADELAFSTALVNKNDSILSILLHYFTSTYPNGRAGFGGAVLLKACLYCDLSVLKLLLKAKLDINSHIGTHYCRDRCAMLPAVIENFTGIDTQLYQVLHQLLRAGADPERVSGKGHTALLAAIKYNKLQVVELLLSRGADINRPARRGLKRTPIQQGCEGGNLQMINYMLDKGADINAPPAMNGGATSLQLAAIQGNARIVKLLLDRGAKIHEAPALVSGRTALQGAAEHGRVSVLELLLFEGEAGFTLEDIESAKMYAEKSKNRGCVDRLNLARFRYGAKAIL